MPGAGPLALADAPARATAFAPGSVTALTRAPVGLAFALSVAALSIAGLPRGVPRGRSLAVLAGLATGAALALVAAL